MKAEAIVTMAMRALITAMVNSAVKCPPTMAILGEKRMVDLAIHLAEDRAEHAAQLSTLEKMMTDLVARSYLVTLPTWFVICNADEMHNVVSNKIPSDSREGIILFAETLHDRYGIALEVLRDDQGKILALVRIHAPGGNVDHPFAGLLYKPERTCH